MFIVSTTWSRYPPFHAWWLCDEPLACVNRFSSVRWRNFPATSGIMSSSSSKGRYRDVNSNLREFHQEPTSVLARGTLSASPALHLRVVLREIWQASAQSSTPLPLSSSVP